MEWWQALPVVTLFVELATEDQRDSSTNRPWKGFVLFCFFNGRAITALKVMNKTQEDTTTESETQPYPASRLATWRTAPNPLNVSLGIIDFHLKNSGFSEQSADQTHKCSCKAKMRVWMWEWTHADNNKKGHNELCLIDCCCLML